MYLAFESRVGDLAAVAKIEKRRREIAAREMGASVQTLLLIDRYKYLDLMPCASEALTMIGYKVRMQ